MYSLFVILSTSFASDIDDVWVQTQNNDERSILYSLHLGFTEQVDGDWVRMHADTEGMARLATSGLQYRPAQRKALHEDYMSPSEMVDAIQSLAADYPSAAKLVQIGWSVEERPVFALQITHSSTPVRSVRILGAHHGDETSSAAVALNTAQYLLQDPPSELNAWLDQHEVWIVPHVNPDGVQRLDRYNANNVDLNRNYDFMWSDEEFRSGEHAFSEPETRNVRAMGSWIPAGLGLSLHSGATNIGWVWNYTESRTGHDQLLEDIAATYASHCATEEFWITNGADWYVTNGDTTDWSYGRHGTLDYTLEVSSHKHPGPSATERVKDEHTEAIEQTILWPWWVAGQVFNDATGHGVPATITLSDADQPIETGPDGRFSRPITEEPVDLRIQSPGFIEQEMRLYPEDSSVQIRLTPTDLSSLYPTQTKLDVSGQFTLTGPASSVVFSRPGHDSFFAETSGDHWVVDVAQLQPGPWNLTIDEMPAPRSIFVPEADERGTVSNHWIDDDTLFIAFDELNAGIHAWKIAGSHRAMVPMTVDTVDDKTIALDKNRFLEDEFEIILWHSGRQIIFDGSHTDDTGEPADTGERPEEGATDTGNPRSNDAPVSNQEEPAPIVSGKLKTSTGCNSTGSYPAFCWLVSLLGLMRMRSE